MLATRPCDSESSRWSFSKFDPSPRKHLGSRMSSTYDSSLSTHQDWQGQYSYLPPEESAVFGQSFDQHHDPAVSSRSPRTVQAVPASIDAALKRGPASPVVDNESSEGKSTSEGKLSMRESVSTIPEDSMYTIKRPDQAHDESATSVDTPALSMGSTHLSSISSTSQATESQHVQMTTNGKVDGIKEEDDEVVDDDDMIDVDGDQPSRPMTAAERTAARRKMKRFRLTHQQTRFLMSEFAKQPHPDAAHRERLSKEIPGLSPRQVQVWFQNRRAKIKRLTADDRNQMIKMRAVPDDFDNVQALHSPYGAVHGLGTPMGPPVEFGNPNYGSDTMMRPLMVDVRRHENDDHLSPTGLTPGFGGIGMGNGNGMSSSELMSPMTPTSGDRYSFGGQMAAPLSAGGRLSSPLAGRQNSIDATLHMTRQNMRPLQPLHLRDPLTRSRSETVHSPLRTSMSWKGESMNYSTYPTPTSASDMTSRQHSVYDPNQMNPSSHNGSGGFDSAGAYAAQNTGYEHHGTTGGLASAQGLGYSMPQQPSATRPSRLRAASATLPLNFDMKEQHRSPDLVTQSASSGQRPRAPSTTSQLDSPSIYTTSYPPAPLTAPLDFSLSKSVTTRNDGQHYSAPQMSAPIHAPSDFSTAFQAGMSAPASRTPMRDSFGGGGPLTFGQGHDSATSFDSDIRGLDRKRSFTIPGSNGNSLDPSDSQP